MLEVLGCLCEQLEAAEAKPCYCGLTMGVQTMPVDACMCNGQGDHCGTAWVRLDGAFASTNFPQPDTAASSCTAPLAYRLHVGVVRCVPGPNAQGKPPTAGQWALATQRMLDDQAAAYRALSCCSVFGKGSSVVGAWFPLGAPDASCAGGYWSFTFRDL